MKNRRHLYLLVCLVLGVSQWSCKSRINSTSRTQTKVEESVDNSDVKMFPKPKEGMRMQVLRLQPRENENELRVELFVGKEMLVDCNSHGLQGQMVQKNLAGWGYTFWEYEGEGHVISTLMLCKDDSKTLEFVKGKPEMARYNSKLPIVLYVKEELEVRYRIWSTETDLKTID